MGKNGNFLIFAFVKNNSGNTILAGIFSLVILMLTLYATVLSSSPKAGSVTQQDIETNIDQVRQTLLAYLGHPYAWQNTVNAVANGDLAACVNDSTTPCPNVQSPLIIYAPDNNPFYDPTDSQLGFNSFGSFCNTYGTSTPGDCVYRYAVTWYPACPALGPCVAPIIKISLVFQTSSNRFIINPTRFNYLTGFN